MRTQLQLDMCKLPDRHYATMVHVLIMIIRAMTILTRLRIQLQSCFNQVTQPVTIVDMVLDIKQPAHIRR
jgi:hypothetical protein